MRSASNRHTENLRKLKIFLYTDSGLLYKKPNKTSLFFLFMNTPPTMFFRIFFGKRTIRRKNKMSGVKTKLDDANRELVKDSSGYHTPLFEVSYETDSVSRNGYVDLPNLD